MNNTGEYIENCEDDVKMEVKSEDDDLKLSPYRKYSEYFEEDVKDKIVDEKNPDTIQLRHECKICSKSYKSKGYLAQHTKSVHKGLKFPCNQCEYKASRQGHLKSHIESKHKKVKYPCNQCDYKATEKGSLKKH